MKFDFSFRIRHHSSVRIKYFRLVKVHYCFFLALKMPRTTYLNDAHRKGFDNYKVKRLFLICTLNMLSSNYYRPEIVSFLYNNSSYVIIFGQHYRIILAEKKESLLVECTLDWGTRKKNVCVCSFTVSPFI